jgi:demethylmenaquinone methyltransferase / 2-methoxy-6-polyprenyl-1,4-benzoquinol methylase
MEGQAVGSHNRMARQLFAPIAGNYDRYAYLLSLGQDARWRSFLVSCVEALAGDLVLDVACGTAAVGLHLVHRRGCRVVGLDQSAEMLARGRRRVERADRLARVQLTGGRAEALPFRNHTFDALTFTYLYRYVDDIPATLQELARVTKPGAHIAGLEFFVPPSQPFQALWQLYVRLGLPLAGALISPGWSAVGRFLGSSISGLWDRYSLDELVDLWQAANIRNVGYRLLSVGGGVVMWGTRGE